jgi:hypothetical protein
MARPLRGRLLGRMREYNCSHTKNRADRQVIGGVEESRTLPPKEMEPENGSELS